MLIASPWLFEFTKTAKEFAKNLKKSPIFQYTGLLNHTKSASSVFIQKSSICSNCVTVRRQQLHREPTYLCILLELKSCCRTVVTHAAQVVMKTQYIG